MGSEYCLQGFRHVMTPPSAALRDRWLEALLPRVPDTGWTLAAARDAAQAAGLSAGDQALAAPGGISDLLEHFFDQAELDTADRIAATDLGDYKVHEKVAFGVRTWLDVLEPHRDAVKRASARGFTPWGAPGATRRTWSVADTVWTAIGDTSADYNYYTKRGLLASVIAPIVLYWQTLPSDEDLDRFIANRLRQAMKFGQAGGRVLRPILDRFTPGPAPSA